MNQLFVSTIIRLVLILLLFLVTNTQGLFQIEKVLEVDLNLSNHRDNKLRYFVHKHNRFIWINDQGIFASVLALNEKLTIQLLMENMSGINKRQQNEL